LTVNRNNFSSLKREDKLFIMAADYNLICWPGTVDAVGRIEQLTDDNFDWDYMIRLARYHDSSAYLYPLFRDNDALELIPESVLSVLSGEYDMAQARFLKKEMELAEIIKSLRDNGIDPIAFKGVTLSKLIYRDPGVRVSRDSDILVHPSEVDRARGVLEKKGYDIFSGSSSEDNYRKHHFHYIFTRGENMDSVVELHWSLLYPYDGHEMPRSELEKEAVEVKIMDYTVNTFLPAHYLWYLPVNLSYCYFLDFRSLLELKHLAMSLNGEEIEITRKMARECGTENELKMAVKVGEVLFGKFLENKVSGKFRPGFLLRHLGITTFSQRGLLWNRTLFQDTHEMVITFLLKKGIKNKLKFMYSIVFPSRETVRRVYLLNLESRSSNRIIRTFIGICNLGKILAATLLLGIFIQKRIFSHDLPEPE